MEKKIRKVIFIVAMVAVYYLSFANEKEKEIKEYTHSLTLNPIFIPFGILHTEYDYKIGEKTSFGIASWVEYKEVRDKWIHLRYMYYTDKKTFNGFAMGITAGVHQSFSDKSDKLKKDTAPVAGVVIQYNWGLGEKKNIICGTGIGFETPLRKLDKESPIPKINGNLRLNFGFLF